MEKEVKANTSVAQPILKKLQNVGYYLLPRVHEHSPGHSGLLVLLHAGPRPDVAFVPHSLQTQVIGHDRIIHWTIFEADTTFSFERTVTPGKIILHDRDGQVAEFFVFGGTLTAEHVDGSALYAFHSPAPVLTVTRTQHNVGTHLAVEAEVLLAEQRAAMFVGDKGFLERLARIDPFQLYVACLEAILTRYGEVANLRRHYRDFYQALLAEKAWLLRAGQWPEKVTTLPALLGH